jgi:hypothetical protein
MDKTDLIELKFRGCSCDNCFYMGEIGPPAKGITKHCFINVYLCRENKTDPDPLPSEKICNRFLPNKGIWHND